METRTKIIMGIVIIYTMLMAFEMGYDVGKNQVSTRFNYVCDWFNASITELEYLEPQETLREVYTNCNI